MDTLIDTIRLATAEGAPAEAKQAGAKACRTILAALEAEPGTSLAIVPAVAPSPLAGADAGQVLDLLIAKLRSMVPDKGSPPTAPTALRIPSVQIPSR